MIFGKEKREMMRKVEDCLEVVQANNTALLRVLSGPLQVDVIASQPHPKEYTEEEQWKAAYALNLCVVSISQIIEYNDLRFMDKEYDNILNNLNLEMMPKDEALLDVLKKILDVITFFKIQDRERQLLEKEYQQKVKDAIWSATPNPSVILAGGSGGWIGLAVTAAVSIGTGYMNYRKEKAKIDLEQERKEWELERSLIEQLHGLRRQLFETAWRLADEYKFSDNLRLTERQIKQFNETLRDDDPLRRYYRLEYVQSQYEAYPPFWYYLGSAALNVANVYENDDVIAKEYLEKAHSYFDKFFAKSAIESKLLREDPVVAQCAFEYIATLELKEKKKMLAIDPNEKRQLIGEKLSLAVQSSGNALDVLQMCALNYLASDRVNEAVRILKMLVNEYYNVSLNAQLLSMLYVKSLAIGNHSAEAEYRLLEKTCPFKIELYPMPVNKSAIAFEELDQVFCTRQRAYLAERYLKAIEAYLNCSETTFNEIWGRDYDISEEIVDFFEKFAQAMDVLRPGSGGKTVKETLARAFGSISKDCDTTEILCELSLRATCKFATFVTEAVICIVVEIINQLCCAGNYEDLSKLEAKLQDFCNRYSLTGEKDIIVNNQSRREETIGSIITGKSLVQIKLENQEFEECMKVVRDAGLKDQIVTLGGKKDRTVECFYFDSRQYEEYLAKHRSLIDSLDGKVLAVIEDQKGVSRIDLVLTTRKVYIVSKHWHDLSWNVERHPSYEEIRISNKGDAIEDNNGHKIYDQGSKCINYEALGEMLYHLRNVAAKYCARDAISETVEAIMNHAKSACSMELHKMISAANRVSNVGYAGELSSFSTGLANEPVGGQMGDDSSAIVTSAISVAGGVTLQVSIRKGSFSVNDQVRIIRSDGQSSHYDTIVHIYAGGQQRESAKEGMTAMFYFAGMSADRADVNSEIRPV